MQKRKKGKEKKKERHRPASWGSEKGGAQKIQVYGGGISVQGESPKDKVDARRGGNRPMGCRRVRWRGNGRRVEETKKGHRTLPADRYFPSRQPIRGCRREKKWGQHKEDDYEEIKRGGGAVSSRAARGQKQSH